MMNDNQFSGNVLGLGNDLVDIARIRRFGMRFKKHFYDRVFTAEEQAYCLSRKDPYPYLAARFAAKEAVSKAFGTGIGAAVGWKSIAVHKNDHAAPYIVLDDRGELLLEAIGGSRVLISLSHTATIAQAIALIIK